MFIGIDVAKASVVVAVHPTGETWTVGTTGRELRALAQRLAKLGPTLIVLEATGGFEVPVLGALAAATLPVSLVQPGRVRHFARAHGQLAKTDVVDARVLAQYAAQLEASQYVMPDAAQRALMLLVARRRQVDEMLVAERQRLEQQQVFRESPVRADLEETIAYLEAKRRDLDRQLHDHIAAHPRWAESAALLRAIPGIGPITLATVFAFLPELGTLTRQQVAALVGVAPMARDSGQWRGPRHIRGGRAALRRVVYMATLTAIRWNPWLQPFYARLVARGKTPKQAIVACMRKLVILLNSILKTKQPWRAPVAATA
jgi:transposase